MFRKIDKLQSEVDDLLDLCTEAGVEYEPTGPEAVKKQRLYVMILKMQDDQLHPRHVHRLGKWLACDNKTLREYVDFQHLTAMLHDHFKPGRFDKILNFLKSRLLSHV